MTAKKYVTTLLETETTAQFARKDAAVAFGERSGQPYTVTSPAGQVVVNTTTASPEADTTEEIEVTTTTEEPKAKVLHTGTPVPYTHGSIPFFTPMSEAAVRLVESKDLTASVDKPNRTVYVHGTKAQGKPVAKEIDALWTGAWTAFKEWKKETKEQRKVWYQTNDGKREMLTAEMEFFQNYFSSVDSLI